jgi:hypothetical protein
MSESLQRIYRQVEHIIRRLLRDHVEYYHADDTSNPLLDLMFTYRGQDYTVDPSGGLQQLASDLEQMQRDKVKCKQENALRGCL